MMNKNQIELLAPAGDAECFLAAISAGADAIFFGLEQFSARTRAKNLSVQEAEYLIPIAHKHNCKAYLTLNTLINDSELQSALELLNQAVKCGIDAVIVQDFGVLELVHKKFPQLEIHASTQMTTHNLAQCEYLAGLGVSQVNLSRELSLEEIQPIAKKLHSENIVPEVFVQGAFCISYSGQCYLSGFLYDEAGNRGSCVQPCRRNWCCVKTEEKIHNGDNKKDFKPYFHLKDNSAFPIAKQLIEENIPISLKIEGRIKSAEYVWAVTSAWREQIDRIIQGEQTLKTSEKLTGAINRDYTCGYLEGKISSSMFSDGTKDFSLVKAGIIKSYVADKKNLIFQNDFNCDWLKSGDLLTIKAANDTFICTAKVLAASKKGYQIQITNKLTKKILPGQIVYKSTSVITAEQLKNKILELAPDYEKQKKCLENGEKEVIDLIPVRIQVSASFNKKLAVTFTAKNQSVTVESEHELVASKSQAAGLTATTLEDKLSKLGGTSFVMESFTICCLEENLFIPLGELNQLRRNAVSELEKICTQTFDVKKGDSENKQNKEGTDLLDSMLETKGTDLSENQQRQTVQEAFLVCADNNLQNYVNNQAGLQNGAAKNPKKLIVEIPSAIETLDKKIVSIIQENTDLVLYFNSILMEQDFQKTLEFILSLRQLSSRSFICDNTGLAYSLRNCGCKIILGPNCNIYNSLNCQKYKTTMNITGIIPSLELKPENLEKLKLPKDIQIWYPKNMHTLLMQSRQCLVKNATNCSKSICDRNCLTSCNKKVLLKGQKNENIIALKRPGFYSALFSANLVDYSENCKALKNVISVNIIDKRM